MSRLKKTTEFVIFSLVSVSMLFIVTLKFWTPIQGNDYITIILYLFLLIFVNSFPLKINEIYVSFILAISITVFLDYGIVVDAWLTQISILISMLISAERRSITRIFLTQMMFIWISLIAGFSFLLTGGTIDFSMSMLGDQLLPITIYTIAYFVTNHTLLYFIRRGLNKNNNTKVPIISDDIIWDAATLLLTVPLGVIMYMVKVSYGTYGMLFVAVPIIIVTHLFRIYSELHHSHNQLKALNKLSASFTSELNLENTIRALQNATRELLTFNFSYIMLVHGDKLKMISIEDYNGGVVDTEKFRDLSISFGEGLSGSVALYKKAQIVGSDADMFELEDEPEFTRDNKSLLSVPMIWNNEIIGVITLGSTNEYHYSKKDLTILKILASQAAVAIQNANRYQRTEEKSMMDELTEVYNYRAFDEMLRESVMKADIKEENLSLLMIDLDHFKQINDQYGHAAGNVVLKEIAKILKELTRKEDIVSRYGGEEFTVIIPNTDCNKAKAIAERIRSTIENHKIEVKNTLNNHDEIKISVTASIGVATYPKMADSAQDILRHADRAMYIGSKQAGRNKVSVYMS